MNKYLFYGAAAAGGAIAGPFALKVLGFGAAGVGAGTVASMVQSWIGNVAAGSMFATSQSAGAAGLGLAGKAVGATCGLAIAKVIRAIPKP